MRYLFRKNSDLNSLRSCARELDCCGTYNEGRERKVLLPSSKRKKDEIEGELGFEIEWMELPEKNASRIHLTKKSENPMDQEKCCSHFSWFQEKLEVFDRVFRPRVQNLNANDWDEDNILEVGNI